MKVRKFRGIGTGFQVQQKVNLPLAIQFDILGLMRADLRKTQLRELAAQRAWLLACKFDKSVTGGWDLIHGNRDIKLSGEKQGWLTVELSNSFLPDSRNPHPALRATLSQQERGRKGSNP
jgi:hypothetical protein